MINNNIDDVDKSFMAKYSWNFIIYIQIITNYAGQTSSFFFFFTILYLYVLNN